MTFIKKRIDKSGYSLAGFTRKNHAFIYLYYVEIHGNSRDQLRTVSVNSIFMTGINFL